MLLAVLFANTDGNILIERFHGFPAEERLHWRSVLIKLGAENLKGAKTEELLVASHKTRRCEEDNTVTLDDEDSCQVSFVVYLDRSGSFIT